ncbi:MAG: hypothetical protein QF893_14925 [Alphaproteobacteria bacterium]|nr:hypothetical protein [Alphaproteobacteria bacterium]
MEFLYLVVVGIVLYVVSDRILDYIERRRGARLEQRSLLFFAILLGLAVITFAIIRSFLAG